jgi:5-hydroxyisourate hydrolase-like protein (transthyretin family)
MKAMGVLLLALLFIQTPKASLEGVVIGRQPVAGARVTLRSPGSPRNTRILTVITNSQGQFSFAGLDEGTYVIAVDANGHLPQTSAAQVQLTAGQSAKDVVIRLTPAATVSGRIRDPQGRPVVDLAVQLVRSSYTFDGKRTYRSSGTVRTNDRGEYRLYWVTPGRYYLLAGTLTTGFDPVLNSIQQMTGAASAAGTPVAPVLGYAFYPGVTEVSSARLLDLQPGADLQGMDLTIAPNPATFRITGHVIDSRTGQAPARANVGLTRIPALDLDNIAGVIGIPNRNYNPATGTFEVRDVLPGPYFVTATVDGTASTVTGTGSVAIAVSNKDVDGVTVSINPGVTIRGRLRVEGELPAEMPISCLRISLVPLQTNDAPLNRLRSDSAQCKQVEADGTFTINDVPAGDYGIAIYGFPVSGAAANRTYQATLVGHGFVREALFQGVDVLGNPLRVVSDRADGSLDIVVAMGGGRIQGVVTDAGLKPLSSKRVVLVPDRGRFQWQLYRTATTNQNGQFSMSTIAPGSYRLYAWETMEDYAWFDPELLARYETVGRSVRVTETSSDTVDLRIIPTEGPR